jgi:putative flavoprotein involved in K+ transport
MTTTIPHRTEDPLDVLVIGAGQAGLAIGHHLLGRTDRFLLVDAGPEIGHSWRRRWDSLRLFSPAEYDGLPGMPFPAPAGTHPGKDDVADYLRAYADRYELPIRWSAPVTRLHRDDDMFVASIAGEELRARQVVVATGPFQTPFVPALSAGCSVPQLHSADYRNPSQFIAGSRVLVVGAANSGLQIAAELVATHRVVVAVGSRSPELPQRILGQDLFRWLDGVGFFTVPADGRIGRRLRRRGDLVIGTRTHDLRARGVEFRPRLAGFDADGARFTDGSVVPIDAVVWATGYRPDHRWLHVPGVVTGGAVRHRAGVTDVPGLYFLGLPWQTSRGSALLGFVGRDAARLAKRMSAPSWSSRVGRVGMTA